MKSSNCHGHDYVTNKILKLINKEISPHLVHLINNIIRTQIFPEIYKISRMTPLSKPDKDDKLPASYRPINNLPAIEKIIEMHILQHLLPFLEQNDIILNNHHGGRHLHSTTTALTDITYKLNNNYENNKISATLTTDLTAAFDTVDTDILLTKLRHYGIRDNELRLIDNYMTDRRQYVQVDTYNSQIDNSPRCSTIQGSKMSGLLYTLYTNEVPLIHNLLYDNLYTTLTNDTQMTRQKDIEHYTTNFVDDSTSVITFNKTDKIKDYLTTSFCLHEQ